MGKQRESAKSTREKAAAARAAAEAAEKRRERTVRIVGAAGVLAVVGVIIGGAVFFNSTSNSGGGVDPGAALPKTVYPADAAIPFGVPVGTATESAPVLTLWEDFQCPACGKLEQLNGKGIQQIAEEGLVRLVYRPTTFLDGNLRNDASARAVSAWGCAIDQGKTLEFHDWVFANQPTEEGTGWTNEQFKQFGADVGITGDAKATFDSCVDDGTYLGWAKNSTAAFNSDGVQGTPAGYLNGTLVPTAVLSDDAQLRKYVADASGTGSPSPSPSS